VFRWLLAALPVLGAAQGCSVVLDPAEAQCETSADCAARGFTDALCEDAICVEQEIVDPVWGCLGNVEEPEPDTSQFVTLSVRLAFATDNMPLASDAVIDVCDKLDIGCTVMSPDYPKGLAPGADGVLEVAVRQGFDGFVRITHPDVMDSRVYVGRPLLAPPKVEEIQLLRPNEYAALAALASDVPDPTRGTAILLSGDCQGEAVGGVRFTVETADADSTEFYLINQGPVIPPGATETDADGFGGYFNLPTGPTVVEALRAADDVYIGESSFQVLEETISYVLVLPTPV
jgi:hypothetical protein